MSSETIIRVSGLPFAPDCFRRYAGRTFRKEIIAAGFSLRTLLMSVGAPVGTAVHKGASTMLAEKAKTGSIGGTDFYSDAAVESLRAGVADGIMYDRESPSLNDAEQQVLRQVASFRAHLAPGIKPILVEERLEATVPGSANSLVLSGQADLICREPGTIDDLKAGKRLGWYGSQLGGYSLLARTHGHDIQKAAVNFVPRVSMKKPQPAPIRESYNVADMEAEASMILHHIDRALTVFRHGDLERRILPGDPRVFPANPQSMLCGAKWCESHGTEFCRAHAKELENTDNG